MNTPIPDDLAVDAQISAASTVNPSPGAVHPFRSWTPMLVGVCAFVLYLATFATLGNTLGARADVIADADTGPFTTMLSEWSPSRQYGNEWNLENRSDLDRTQEHKIKHVLLGVVFGPIATVGASLGVDRFLAAKVASALCGAVNVALVMSLLTWMKVRQAVALPITLMLLFAPGQWVFAALPESWPLTGTFVLAAILLQVRFPDRPLLFGMTVGLGMLNNIALAVTCVLPVVDTTLRQRSWPELLRNGGLAGMGALATWSGSLWVLSLFDPDLRPDRVLSFLTFFSDLVGGTGGSAFHVRLFRSVTQVGLAAFAGVQPDPITGSIITSARFSTLSVVGMSIVAALNGCTAWTLFQLTRTRAQVDWRLMVLTATAFGILWSLLFWRFPIFTWFYSPALLPPLAITIGLILQHRERQGILLSWLGAGTAAFSGVAQVLLMRSLVLAA